MFLVDQYGSAICTGVVKSQPRVNKVGAANKDTNTVLLLSAARYKDPRKEYTVWVAFYDTPIMPIGSWASNLKPGDNLLVCGRYSKKEKSRRLIADFAARMNFGEEFERKQEERNFYESINFAEDTALTDQMDFDPFEEMQKLMKR